MLKQLWNDEFAVVVSAELVLILTILVIGLIVGLAEVQYAVVTELTDVSDAIGHINQSYFYTGFSAIKKHGGLKSATDGSMFRDGQDACDPDKCQGIDVGCDAPIQEAQCGRGYVY